MGERFFRGYRLGPVPLAAREGGDAAPAVRGVGEVTSVPEVASVGLVGWREGEGVVPLGEWWRGPWVVPWPPSGLSPNARLHWAAKARLAAGYRTTVRVMVQAEVFARFGLVIPCKPSLVNTLRCRLRVELGLVTPTGVVVQADVDNLVSRCKAGLDGLADALGFDDGAIDAVTAVRTRGRGAGTVEIRLAPLLYADGKAPPFDDRGKGGCSGSAPSFGSI